MRWSRGLVCAVLFWTAGAALANFPKKRGSDFQKRKEALEALVLAVPWPSSRRSGPGCCGHHRRSSEPSGRGCRFREPP